MKIILKQINPIDFSVYENEVVLEDAEITISSKLLSRTFRLSSIGGYITISPNGFGAEFDVEMRTSAKTVQMEITNED